MKFIRKTSEPQVFADWKQKNPQKGWDNFQSNKSRRLLLRDFLLGEQGYICCYCEREIDEDTRQGTCPAFPSSIQ